MRTCKRAIGCAYRRWASAVTSDNGTVIHEADRSLAAWLASMLPDGITITFEPPGPSWPQQSPPRPFVDAFLYDISEVENGLTADLSPVRAPNGDLIGRRPSVRRYRLSFALTAWTTEATAGHELLGSIMAGCAASEIIPPECLHGALAEAGLPVPVRCAPAELASSSLQLWQSLGVPPQTTLALVMTVPVVPAPETGLETLVRRLDLDMAAEPGGASHPDKADAERAGTRSGQHRERGRITERHP
jgi:Pvc16 N-terminal domain